MEDRLADFFFTQVSILEAVTHPFVVYVDIVNQFTTFILLDKVIFRGGNVFYCSHMVMSWNLR